ncbi:hypothetical protein FQN54_004844 [Arachnomyces sp. PD_36]|nr:hypothetical protein FQN54_004844 [Arachnomyces sp. PD_36]
MSSEDAGSGSSVNRPASPAESQSMYHPARENVHDGHGGEDDDDDDTNDPDYEPNDEEIEYFDAESDTDESMPGLLDESGNFSGVEIEIVPDTRNPDSESDDPRTEQGQVRAEDGPTQITPSQLFQLLGPSGLRRILQTHAFFPRGADDEEEGDSEDWEDDDHHYGFLRGSARERRRNRRPLDELYPKVPSEAGIELMGSGHYGSNSHYADEVRQRRKRLASKLMWRELGYETQGAQKRAKQQISQVGTARHGGKLDANSRAQDMIPGTVADKIIHYNSRCYSGQFSDDGNFFFSCAQDFNVRMYDTSNPYDWKYYKTVRYPFGQWTITDATLSPDNRFLAYSSIRHMVSLAATDPHDKSDPTLLDFSISSRDASGTGFPQDWDMAIWSLRFSGDGREIVAGTSKGGVIVYDLETRQSILRLRNHQDDVNAVCFGDASSPHILYSGSDDTTLRVWDRRSMGDGREAGVFMGHTEGITYVDSKGDGRYILSNAKDQTMKLWDLRKMMTTTRFDTIIPSRYSTGFDYRFMPFPEDDYEPHPHDCSVVTFRGHSVLQTLIRCHFSPPGSTNSRYVYTGSRDGKVYVYNLDATLAGTIDVGRSTKNSRPQNPQGFSSRAHWGEEDDRRWKTCVRDASWHPNAPVLAATSWNGWGMTTGTCSIHSWNDDADEDEGDPPLGKSYDSQLRPLLREPPTGGGVAGRSGHGLRSHAVRANRVFVGDDDDEMLVW